MLCLATHARQRLVGVSKLHTLNTIDRRPPAFPVLSIPDTMNICLRNSVVENLLFLVTIVAKTIPLARNLAVECPNIVIDSSRRLVNQLLME